MSKRLAIILLLFTSINSIKAQSTDHLWGAFMYSVKLNQQWSFIGDVQWRSSASVKGTGSMIFRPGISYQLNPHIAIAGGYAHIPFESGDEFIAEKRIWEQILLTHKNRIIANSNTHFTHRVRAEQRWIPTGNDLYPPKHHYANRLRYFIRTVTPLFAAEISPKNFFLGIQNEVFINVKGIAFDQNRLYLSVGYRVNPKLDVESGFIMLSSGQSSDRRIIQLATYLRL